MAFCRDIPSNEKNPDPGDKNPRDIPKIKNPEKIPNPGNFGILGIFRDFQIRIPIPGISGFSEFLNPDPDTRDFGIFGIFRSNPKLKIPISNKSHPESNSGC